MPTLQEQVNTASAGTVIQHDGEFVGNLTINKPLTITGPGRIVTPNADPAITIPPSTGPVVLRELEITTDGKWAQVHDLVRWGDGGAAQDTLAKVPQGLTIDSCDIHGQPHQPSQRGISANGANLKVLKSKIREIHWKGFDTQAIGAWNGPGPFLIEDTYLEAAGENIMFGGSMVSIPNLVPADITIRRCHFFKPLSWKGVWTVKNLFELKNARRVLVEGSVFENCWIDGQDGYAWVFTVRGEAGGRNPWNVVEDITMRDCTVKNTNRGIQTLGRDDLDVAQQGRRLTIYNCLFEGIADWFHVQSVFDDVRIEHCTHRQGGNNIVFTGGKSRNFAYLNNATEHSGYGFRADGGGEGVDALNQYCDGWRMAGNVIAGMAPSFMYPTGNFFPASLGSLADFKGTDGVTPGRIQGTMPQPAPLPAPTPTPTPAPAKTESANGAKSPPDFLIVDANLITWTIGSPPDFLVFQNGVYKGGAGTVLKYWNKQVYTLGLDGNWWRWTSREWEKLSASEPGGTPSPIPEPVPTPTPIPAPAPPRTVAYPKQPSKRNPIIEAQWKDRFRLRRENDDGTATFEQVT